MHILIRNKASSYEIEKSYNEIRKILKSIRVKTLKNRRSLNYWYRVKIIQLTCIMFFNLRPNTVNGLVTTLMSTKTPTAQTMMMEIALGMIQIPVTKKTIKNFAKRDLVMT